MKLLIRLINISLFCTGFTYIIDEFILAQTGTNILGNSHQQWPIIITSMLVSSAIAITVTKYIPRKHIVTAFLTFEILLSLIGGFSPILIMSSFAYLHNHFLLIFYGIAVLIGFFHGFQPVLIGYLNDELDMEFKENFASVLSLDALGVAAGGFIYHKFIIGQIPLYHGAFFATAVNLFSAIVVFFLLRRLKDLGKIDGIIVPKIFSITIVISALVSIWAWTKSKEILFTAEQQLFTGRIIHLEDTKYQHIVLTKDAAGVGNLYLNTGLQFSTADEGRYHENLVHPALLVHEMISKDTALQVLVLGGGDGFAVRELKKYRNIKNITLVDLDPAMTKLAKENKDMVTWNDSAFFDKRLVLNNATLPSSNTKVDITSPINTIPKNKTDILKLASVNLLHQDAYKFIEDVANKNQKYDIIIIDFPDPRSEAVAKLYSDYFFSKVKSTLSKKGIIAIQAGSPIHSNLSYLCIGKSMNAAGLDILPYHDNVPSFEQWGWYLASNKNDNIPWNKITPMVYAQPSFAVNTTYLTPAKFFANTIFGKDLMQKWDEVEVNTILNPIVYIYFTRYGWK